MACLVLSGHGGTTRLASFPAVVDFAGATTMRWCAGRSAPISSSRRAAARADCPTSTGGVLLFVVAKHDRAAVRFVDPAKLPS
jgi:hypothetical protein